jgi:phage shock protein A
MTGEEMERAIGFLLDHHAKVSADIERHSEQIAQLTSAVSKMQGQLDETRAMVESVITEMREGFDNLTVANEVTRKLSEDVARLTIAVS